MNLLAPKIDKESGNNLQKEINPYLTVEWKDFAASLLPHIVYPAQEGYRVSLISKKNIELNGFVQQADCLAFQNVQVDDIILGGQTVFNGPLKVENPCLGLEILKIPPLISEWDAFFKNFVFDNVLSSTTRVVIHFSTSVYSKLIINCSVKQRSLSNETIFGSACNEARPVVETVARIGQSGICQSLVGSQPAIVVAQTEAMGMHNYNPEVTENKCRFDIALKSLHESDSALVVRTKSPKVLENITIKRLYVLLPCIEEGYFLMLQITPAELVLPQISLSVDMKEYDQEDELLENIKAEVTSSLNKIPFQEYYDPFEHSSGIIKALEAQNAKVCSSTKKPQRTSQPAGASQSRGRGSRGASRGGRGRGTPGQATKNSVKFNPIVKRC